MTDAYRMRRRKPPVRLDQELEIGPQRLPHRPDIIDCEILVAAVDVTAPWAGERIELGGGKTHRLDLQPALDAFLDGRSSRPAIGVDAHALARGATDQVVDGQSDT